MILVVGGAGYIGSHTNRLLDERGYQTVVFDNLETGHVDFVQWGKSKLAVKDLNNIYKLPSDNDDIDRPLTPYLDTVDIKCSNIKFGYSKEKIAINVASLNIKQGEKVAILGKIGSGKSTLLKLIMNLYEPTKGSVLIDGLDTRQIDPTDLRHAIGSVPQEPFLFMGTIKDNLTIGEQYVSDEELLRVSKIAGLDDFLGKH